jgi:hypothetical protein
MAELAPALCSGCADYHLRFVLTRFASPGKGVAVDRPLLVKRVQQILADVACRQDGPLDIVIAGAADTGILATCAHATAVMCASLHSRCRFIVLDRCRSPLALCDEFAKRHGLTVRSVQADLVAGSEEFAADLVVSHSFLRFIDRAQQIALLKRFGTWLKPRGRIMISQSLRVNDGAALEKEEKWSASVITKAKAAIADGTIKITPEAELLFERIHATDLDYLCRPGDIGSVEELRQLLAEASLQEHSMDVMEREFTSAREPKHTRVRAIAVYGSSAEA